MPATVELNGRSFDTAMLKQSVTQSIEVGPLGIEGDAVADTKHHGGIDQAAYAYSITDYEWSNDELDRERKPGKFGEHLTIERTTGPSITMAEMVKITYDKQTPLATLKAALQASISERTRAAYQQRLENG